MGKLGTLLPKIAAFPLWSRMPSLPQRWAMASPSSCPVCLANALPSFFTSFSAHWCQPPTLVYEPSLREGVKYYFADFVRKGGTPLPPFTDFSPKKILQKGLKIVFFAQKTPNFGPKNRLRIWGVPPSPPLRIFFQQKGGYGFGGYPPPLYGQNPQSSI